MKLFLLLCFLGLAIAHDGDTLGVQLTTWNVNDMPPPEDVSGLFGLHRHPDVIAIGLQGIRFGSEANSWGASLDSALLARGYLKIGSVESPGVLLLTYIRDAEVAEDIRTGRLKYSSRTMIGGTWIGFNLADLWFSFISAEITRDDQPQNHSLTMKEIKRIEEEATFDLPMTDYVFYMGDMNIQLSHHYNLSPAEVNTMIGKGQLSELLKMDELAHMKRLGDFMTGYQEMQISFPPTYKFMSGSDTYDLSRKPAWTDRVLYRAEPGREITPVYYGSIPHYHISVHKPVEAFFLIPVERQNRVLRVIGGSTVLTRYQQQV